MNTDMQNIVVKMQSLFTKRMVEYEATTNEILRELQFAVDGISEYFLSTGLHITVEDITIIKGIFVFTVVVETPLSDRTQMFNVGIPPDILSAQSKAAISQFLTAASEAAQNEQKMASFQPPTSKRWLH